MSKNLPTHSLRSHRKCDCIVATKHYKKQQEKLETLRQIGTALHILVMNVGGLSTEKGVKFARKIFSVTQIFDAL